MGEESLWVDSVCLAQLQLWKMLIFVLKMKNVGYCLSVTRFYCENYNHQSYLCHVGSVVESSTAFFPVQGLGFASTAGTTLKGRSIKAADNPHHRLVFYSRRSFPQKRCIFRCFEVVMKKNAVRNLLSLEGVFNISRRTGNVSGGGTRKSKREGEYLRFVQQDCFEKNCNNNSS